MPYIEWTHDLELGIPLIDRDHKILVSILNQVYAALGNNEEMAVLGSALNSLIDYTEYHFDHEECLLETADYAALAPHRKGHGILGKQVHEIWDRYVEDAASVRGEEVLTFLRTWLVDHILKQDMEYRDHCIGNAAAYAAAEAMSFRQHMSKEAQASASPAAPESIDWGALRVLIVEDNHNFQLIIQTILKSLGVRNLTAVSHGGEGLEVLENKDMDLVLCDWRMDTMDGMEFARRARACETTARIIMMSGYSRESVADLARATGVDAFLEKPITARGFLQTARAVLSRH